MGSSHTQLLSVVSRCLQSIVLATFLGLACTASTRGEALFRLEPVGAGAYVISGVGLEKIAALDFFVTYDAATARNPRVAKGPFVPADASFFANTAIPGEFRVMIIRGMEIAGSGILATVTLEKTGSAEPRIISFKSNPISVTAAPVNASAGVSATNNSGATSNDKSGPVSDGSGGSAAGTVTSGPDGATVSRPAGTTRAAGGVIALGSVTMTGERADTEKEGPLKKEAPLSGTVTAEQQTVPADIPPDSELGRVEPTATKSDPKPKYTVYQSVLERMKGYTGERTATALLGLFNTVAGQEVRQEPQIVVSDGKNRVTLYVGLPLPLKNSPVFSFQNASMVALEQAENGSWMIEVIPRKNSLEARITVGFDGSEISWPLAVVPPIDPELLKLNGSTEAAFTRFLNQRGSDRDPRLDLNKDGKFDYLDDYLFAAHYLAARQK